MRRAFETWIKLKANQQREDDTGKVARWVKARIEERDWPNAKLFATHQISQKVPASDEKLFREWEHYLMNRGMNNRDLAMFERVFAEWQEARDI